MCACVCERKLKKCRTRSLWCSLLADLLYCLTACFTKRVWRDVFSLYTVWPKTLYELNTGTAHKQDVHLTCRGWHKINRKWTCRSIWELLSLIHLQPDICLLFSRRAVDVNDLSGCLLFTEWFKNSLMLFSLFNSLMLFSLLFSHLWWTLKDRSYRNPKSTHHTINYNTWVYSCTRI